jgi:hypothetical protein
MDNQISTFTRTLCYLSNLSIAVSLYTVVLVYLSTQKEKPLLDLSKKLLMIEFSPEQKPDHIQKQISQDIQTYIDNLSAKRVKYKQYIHHNLVDNIIEPEELVAKWNGKYKKLLVITPGGFYGFYMLGITRYIKRNIDIDDYVFSGSSAGSWCALFLCLKNKKNITMLLFQLISGMQEILVSATMYEFLFEMKRKVLELTTDADYDFERLHIGVLKYENYELKTTIYTGFTSLEDAVNCCISSSNIPFLTGEFAHTYQGSMAIDGVFAKYPYLNVMEPSLVIHPDIWKTPHRKNLGNSLLAKDKIKLMDLFLDGYNDTIIHHDVVCQFLD